MRKAIILLSNLGNYLVSLSDRTRLQLVMLGLMLLGGGGIYKLYVSIQQLNEPLPAASPAQLIKPMEGLLKQTSAEVSNYRIERNRNLKKLDSLRFMYSPKNDIHP
jgi:hypothetical protein